MDFIEYFKESVKKVENEDCLLRMATRVDDFKIHKDCFCDWHDDFVIIYDKQSDASIVAKYDSIDSLRYISREEYEEGVNKIKSGIMGAMLKSMMD